MPLPVGDSGCHIQAVTDYGLNLKANLFKRVLTCVNGLVFEEGYANLVDKKATTE